VHRLLEVVHSLAAEVDTLQVDTLARNLQEEAHSQVVVDHILEEEALHGQEAARRSVHLEVGQSHYRLELGQVRHDGQEGEH